MNKIKIGDKFYEMLTEEDINTINNSINSLNSTINDLKKELIAANAKIATLEEEEKKPVSITIEESEEKISENTTFTDNKLKYNTVGKLKEYLEKEIKIDTNKNEEFSGSFGLNRRNDSKIGENSVSIGTDSAATEKDAIALGKHVTASKINQTVLGKYNNINNMPFVIGNGSEVETSNAAAIDDNGNLKILGDVLVNCEKDSSGGNSIIEEIENIEKNFKTINNNVATAKSDAAFAKTKATEAKTSCEEINEKVSCQNKRIDNINTIIKELQSKADVSEDIKNTVNSALSISNTNTNLISSNSSSIRKIISLQDLTLKRNILNVAYPIGVSYQQVDKKPSELFGFTWELVDEEQKIWVRKA